MDKNIANIYFNLLSKQDDKPELIFRIYDKYSV